MSALDKKRRVARCTIGLSFQRDTWRWTVLAGGEVVAAGVDQQEFIARDCAERAADRYLAVAETDYVYDYPRASQPQAERATKEASDGR